MSDSSTDNGSASSSPIADYDDYYDLLGVSEDAGEDEVIKKARKLLGKYHPDVSDHPDADTIFKEVNRAQDVLTDTEQRKIYNSLGHDEYVKRREEGGEMTLSEDINGTGNDFSAATNAGTETKSTGTDQTASDTETTTTDVASDHGSTSRNERNTWAGRIREHSSYQSVTEFDLSLTPEETVKKMYREVWLTRLAFSVLFGTGLVYFSFEDPDLIMNLWRDLGAPTQYGLSGVVTACLAAFSAFITLVSGLAAYRLLKSVEDEVDVETAAEKERRKRDKARARGLNTSVSEPGSRASSSKDSRSSWDVHSRYDSAGAEGGESKVDSKERRNWSLKQGNRLLFAGLLMTAFGAFMNGIHPWTYLQLLLGGAGINAPLWWETGREGAREVIVLLNAGYSFTMLVVAVTGLLSTMHGLSREVWFQRYFRGKGLLPFLWDTAILALGATGGMGLVLGTAPIPNLPVEDLPPYATTFLAADDGFTSLSAALAAMTGLFVLVTWFRIRRRF